MVKKDQALVTFGGELVSGVIDEEATNNLYIRIFFSRSSYLNRLYTLALVRPFIRIYLYKPLAFHSLILLNALD